jgi:hypothetical protein
MTMSSEPVMATSIAEEMVDVQMIRRVQRTRPTYGLSPTTDDERQP